MTAHVVQPFVTEIFRDLRDGVPIETALVERSPAEIKARFIDSMRTDLDRAGEDHRYACVGQFREMGLPRDWIREALGLPADRLTATPDEGGSA